MGQRRTTPGAIHAALARQGVRHLGGGASYLARGTAQAAWPVMTSAPTVPKSVGQ